ADQGAPVHQRGGEDPDRYPHRRVSGPMQGLRHPGGSHITPFYAERQTGMTKGAITMEITERVAYLKGLAEGMELNTEKREGKLLSAILDVLEDIALELEDIRDEQAELADGLDAVSDDLEDVEDAVFE